MFGFLAASRAAYAVEELLFIGPLLLYAAILGGEYRIGGQSKSWIEPCSTTWPSSLDNFGPFIYF